MLDPILGSYTSDHALSKYELNQESVAPEVAYRIVKDQLIDEGNARENLATFCQTYMEPKATEIMAETMQKNAIDKDEYPRTAELENRCVNIIANLWHGQKMKIISELQLLVLLKVACLRLGNEICMARAC